MALNPHQKNKVDISSLTEEEQKLFRLYGKLPNKKDLLQNKLKERKYFDSGDYAMSKAGKSDGGLVGGLGREHPSPESIPHLSQQQQQQPNNGNGNGAAPTNIPRPDNVPALHPTLSHGGGGGQAGSPVKESSILHRGMSVDEQGSSESLAAADEGEGKGIPIRK